MASAASRNRKSVERLRFGEMAIRKGYCARAQVEEALRVQRALGARGQPRPLLGLILVKRGFLSTGQLIDVLRTYEQEHGRTL